MPLHVFQLWACHLTSLALGIFFSDICRERAILCVRDLGGVWHTVGAQQIVSTTPSSRERTVGRTVGHAQPPSLSTLPAYSSLLA